MCGRIGNYYGWKEIEEEFDPDRILAEYYPNYNIAPSMNIPVIAAGSTVFDTYKWGLIPHWAKDSKVAMANARAETILEKPWFKEAFLSYRVLVPVSCFYEWSTSKTPHFIQVKGKKVFALAGIASIWKPKDGKGESIKTVCLITTDANKDMKKVHHRMPVIINPKDYHAWIDPKNNDEKKLLKLLIPYKKELTIYPISKEVNKVSNNNSKLIKKA